jgi:predicted RNA-binding protein associated with RNAse of E/G family
VLKPIAPLSTSPSGDSLASKLKQLEEAYQAGLITEAQYQQAKQEVLDNHTQQ